jgi:hypothetical protein
MHFFVPTKWLAHNQNYISIGVSVRTTKFAARNDGGAVRQESNPQSPTVYSSVRNEKCLQRFFICFSERGFA